MADERNGKDPSYSVGHCRPPMNTRFRKGISGNPGGRPRGKAESLILKEAYRLIEIRDGDQVSSVPAFQAVIRSLILHAAKGSGPAQRLVVTLVPQVEQQVAAAENKAAQQVPNNITVNFVDADGKPMPNLLEARDDGAKTS